MQVKTLVLFAGGRGTRLSELTKQSPKPATLVNGRPLITYLIDWAQHNQFKKVIVCGGYLFNTLRQVIFAYYSKQDVAPLNLQTVSTIIAIGEMELQIIDTGIDASTGERLRLIQDEIKEEYFMCTYADTLSDIDLRDIVCAAKIEGTKFQATLGHPDARYGEIVIKDGYITRFKEKATPNFLINRGFYVFHCDLFQEIGVGESLEEDVLPRLALDKKLRYYISSCWFHSVDSISDLESLEDRLNSKLM
jgi:glucose-1-phosphate cytidylyltransferase